MQIGIDEIRRQYKYAKDKKKCVSILADLNCCSKSEILGILHPDGDRKQKAVRTRPDTTDWQPSAEAQALIARLDELDAMIKPLEDEYKRTADALKRTFAECPD